MGVIYQTNIVDFLLVTVFLGGGAAYLVGRAMALTWVPQRNLVVYIILLERCRPLHPLRPVPRHACFPCTTSSSIWSYLRLLAALGYPVTRAGQMAEPVRLALPAGRAAVLAPPGPTASAR